MAVAGAALALLVSLGGCLSHVLGGGGPAPVDFVSSKTYTKMVVEVDTIQGMAPPSGVLDFAKGRLESVLSKPGGIEFRNDETLPARGGSWSVKDIEQYDAAHQGTHTGGDTAVLHVLFVDGHSSADSGNGKVLGTTLTSTSATGKVTKTGPVVIFSQSIADSCQLISDRPCTDPTPMWRAVLVHEFGHAIGLVNNGIPMVKPHEATTCNGAADQKHSTNQNDVMNCNVESSNVLAVFGGGIPNDYDADDRADLCHAGGKC